MFKINKTSRKGRRKGASDLLVLKAASGASLAGLVPRGPQGRRKETCPDGVEAGGREGRIPGLMGDRCGLGSRDSFPQDSCPLWELQPQRPVGVGGSELGPSPPVRSRI